MTHAAMDGPASGGSSPPGKRSDPARPRVIDESNHAPARIVMIREVTPELAVWRVRPRGAEIPFYAGQYVAVGLPLGERLVERPYSICSAPHEPELEFFIELVPGRRTLTPRLF